MSESIRERGRRIKDAPMFKLMVMGGLILILLIPLGMVSSLIYERQARRGQAVQEVASTWGGAQRLSGPLLTVPYRRKVKDEKGKVIGTETLLAQFLPEALHVEARILPERRSRGIFEAVLYRTELQVTGTFKRPAFSEWFVNEDIQWNDAHLSIGLPDLRGLRHAGNLLWQGRPLMLEPGGAEAGLWESGLRAAVPGLGSGGGGGGESFTFAFKLDVDGSGSLEFLPLGKETTVALRSPWPDPSFVGSFLPESRTVRPNGFTATWSVPYYARSYPQQWLAGNVAQAVPPAALNASAFGVSFLLPVDSYKMTERSQKYAVLFLLLTFLTFFLYEMWSPVAVHPLQYLLVGAALCLFYLLLLSISEHVAFGPSYAIAAAATVLLITGYAWAILAGRLRALLLGSILGFLYGYLYVLLQAEDYALLLGSVGLFVILGLVMYLTRRINGNRGNGGTGGTGKRPGVPPGFSPNPPPPSSSEESQRMAA
jgi:inner membrane protein